MAICMSSVGHKKQPALDTFPQYWTFIQKINHNCSDKVAGNRWWGRSGPRWKEYLWVNREGDFTFFSIFNFSSLFLSEQYHTTWRDVTNFPEFFEGIFDVIYLSFLSTKDSPHQTFFLWSEPTNRTTFSLTNPFSLFIISQFLRFIPFPNPNS